ncbi:hypothetical protein PSFL_25740 [Pseudomonas sp. DD1]|uniref:Abi-alpha family protein n=1 Tax=Pseudomonas sp. DD1 TaxID=879558 RepID=UPI0037C56176
MSDDNSVDIFGTKPIAKAVEKITEKSVDGLGAFFGAICMPAAEELGLLLKDKIAVFRTQNLEAIAEKTREKMERAKITSSGDTNPMLVRQVIEDASWTDDPRIQSMWAGLLAIASGTPSAADDSIIYTETLKRLTPFQARIINAIYSDPRCCSVGASLPTHAESFFQPSNRLLYTVREILAQYPGDLSEIVPISATHDEILAEGCNIALSRFRPQLESLATSGLIYSVNFPVKLDGLTLFIPTLKGLDFYMRCLGYSIYPLEAFMLTLQHWCSLRGIDPYTYAPPRT